MPFILKFLARYYEVVRITSVGIIILARLSKAKSTTHDFEQAIMKKLLKQKTYYPIS